MKKEENEKELGRELREKKISPKKRREILKEIREKKRKKKTMKLAVKEGGFASVMSSLSNSYMIPYALALNATNFQIGLLKSFHGLLPPITQLYSSELMKKKTRKQIILTNVILQAFMLFPIILLSLLFFNNILATYLPYFLIIFYTLFAVFGALATPAWFSLMGDIVPNNKRGQYFGKRNRILGIVGLISTLIAAFLLDYFKTKGILLFGFSILFFIASLARFTSAHHLKKFYSPKFKYKKNKFSFLSLLKSKKSNFRKFAFFAAIMYFSVMIASPFFSVFMLTELNFNYVTFMAINLSATLASLITAPLWGKFSDKYGRKESLVLSSIFISVMPILWFFSTSPFFLVLPMLIVGVGWSGFGLGCFDFIYDLLGPEKRSKGLAYYNILLGIGIFLGASLGGLLLKEIEIFTSLINPFFAVFFISFLARTLTSMIFLPKIKEVRKVKKFKPKTILKRFSLTHNIGHEIQVLENKFKKSYKK